MLEQVHNSVFKQARPAERGEKVPLHAGKIFLHNRVARDQNNFHRLGEFMLVQTETFAEQPAGAAAGGRVANFFAGHDT